MGTYRMLFAVFSTLSLLTLLWTGVRETIPEWKSYQTEYYDQLEAKLEASGTSEFNRPLLEIQQIWLPDLRKTDRCTTCHMGIENTEFFTDAQQPFKAHPGKYLEWHPPNKFGCTSCHHGQGLATDFAFAAHTPPDLDVERWERLVHWAENPPDDPTSVYQTVMQAVDVEALKKAIEEAKSKLERWKAEYGYSKKKLAYFHDYMLPKKYIESSCMQCHDSRSLDASVAPTIAKARQLITEVHKCRRCHVIPQIADVPGEPEAPCPDLHGFANKNAHNLDFGSTEAVHPENNLPHTGAEIDVLRSMHHDPLQWTVEHFINPQLFIMTSQMAQLPMSYEDAEALTAFVRGLYKALPTREYVASRPPIPAESLSPDIPSMFVPLPVTTAAATQAGGTAATTPAAAPPAAVPAAGEPPAIHDAAPPQPGAAAPDAATPAAPPAEQPAPQQSPIAPAAEAPAGAAEPAQGPDAAEQPAQPEPAQGSAEPTAQPTGEGQTPP
jgi:hypothetical protein